MDRVGVILNQNGEIASFIDGVKIEVYERATSGWFMLREIKECFALKKSINEMRNFLTQLVIEMQDCKVLIGTIITGLPYMMLDMKGIMLCEATVMSDHLLTTVADDYAKMEMKKEKDKQTIQESYPTTPYETDECGIYELDLRKLQEIHPEISTKKALIPFLKEIKFENLIVYCSHVMPWLDIELKILGLIYGVERLSENGYKVLIRSTHFQCDN